MSRDESHAGGAQVELGAWPLDAVRRVLVDLKVWDKLCFRAKASFPTHKPPMIFQHQGFQAQVSGRFLGREEASLWNRARLVYLQCLCSSDAQLVKIQQITLLSHGTLKPKCFNSCCPPPYKQGK